MLVLLGEAEWPDCTDPAGFVGVFAGLTVLFVAGKALLVAVKPRGWLEARRGRGKGALTSARMRRG